ncbi:MAG TPA: hypothetical protein VN663_11070 [Ramlibacter sp.]|nr:hypothetical protein [Ramlibacter sp.]
MGRIIDGILYERIRRPGVFKVSTKTCGPIMERTVSPAYCYEDMGPAPAFMLIPADRELSPELDAEYIAELKEQARRRHANRAKMACKWFIIHCGFNELLTLTYRENQTDEALAKKHHKEWVRRMRRALGGRFDYCTGFEPQERGAWHMHVACHRLPKHVEYQGVKIEAWKLGTVIWRSIVGDDNGLCFVGGKASKWGKKRRKNMGLYKMASYVSKYITKHYAMLPDGVNRYSHSEGKPKVDRQVTYLAADYIGDLITACFQVPGGSVIVSHRFAPLSEFYILATEAP